MAFDHVASTGRNDWQCPTCRAATRARAGVFAIPNNPLIVAAAQALCAGGESASLIEGGWRRDREGWPYYEFWSGSGGRIRVRVDAENAARAWSEVGAISALTLDVAVSLLAALCADAFRAASCAPRREGVWLGAPAVLGAKNYRRFGTERLQFAQAVEAEIARVMRLRFDIIAYPAFSPSTRTWDRSGVTRRGVALIEPAEEHSPADPLNCARGVALRFGEWAEHWLNAAGPMWVSPLPQKVIELDHRDNRGADVLAKKLSLLLALNWGAARRNKQMRLVVRVLLRRIGELRRPGVEQLQHTGRFADRLEEALLRLSERNIVVGRPASDEAALLRAAGRRWFDTWLDSEIVFDRPSFIAGSAGDEPIEPRLATP